MPAYKNFLSDIGYLLPEGAPFKVGTSRVDPGLAAMSGPQLVCPMAFKNVWMSALALHLLDMERELARALQDTLRTPLMRCGGTIGKKKNAQVCACGCGSDLKGSGRFGAGRHKDIC